MPQAALKSLKVRASAQVLAFLEKHPWTFRVEGGLQLLFNHCPFCGDEKKHFYINAATGQFRCWKCNNAGSLYQLKRFLGEEVLKTVEDWQHPEAVPPPSVNGSELAKRRIHFQKALKADAGAFQYLTNEWGLSQECLNHFGIGLRLTNKCHYVSIPWVKESNVVNFLFRTLPPEPKRFARVEGGESCLFNGDYLRQNPEAESVFLLEGAKDALCLWSQGKQNVVANITGAEGFLPEWLPMFEQVKRIYIVYDPDIQGRRGAKRTAEILGMERCYDVRLDTEGDVTDYFVKQKKSAYDFQALVQKARPFEHANILTASEALKQSIEEDLVRGTRFPFTTPWESLTQLVGGFDEGDLVVLSGPAGVGKTSFVTQMVWHNSIDSAVPCLLYCQEMRPSRLVRKFVSLYRRVASEHITDVDLHRTMYFLKHHKIFIGYDYERRKPKEIMELLRQTIKRYGIRFIVFDNLHFLIRSIQHVPQEIAHFSQQFKLLAEETKSCIVLIVQPRKLSPGKVMEMWDARDSSSIPADCDVMMVLHRKQIKDGEDFKYDTRSLVRVLKNRWKEEGQVSLEYEGNQARFVELVTNDRGTKPHDKKLFR